MLRGPRDRAAPRSRLGRLVDFVLLPLTVPGRLFNRAFAASGRGYVKLVGLGLRVPLLVLAGYLAIVGAGVAGLILVGARKRS